jgi:hypothetical protein
MPDFGGAAPDNRGGAGIQAYFGHAGQLQDRMKINVIKATNYKKSHKKINIFT